MKQKPQIRSLSGRIGWLGIIVITLAAMLVGTMVGRWRGQGPAFNARTPGETIDLKYMLQPGKINIVDFYSDYCPPCREVGPKLGRLAKKRTDIRVLKLDVNRKGVRGIDWGSPLLQQFGIRSIPHFKVFNGDGRLIAEGEPASSMVYTLLYREKLM